MILLLTLLSTLTLCAQEQEIEVQSHVVDAQTGEALPFVNVYVTKNMGTLSNMEGDFTIKVNADATLRLSCVGYETIVVQAAKVSSNIMMNPLTKTLSEVRAMPWETILMKAVKKLNKEYDKRKKKTSRYFYRMTMSYRKKSLVEAFMEANSAVNLREIKFLRGRHGRMTQEGLSDPFIANMNFHHPLELGMIVRDNKFWNILSTPMNVDNSITRLANRYIVQAEELRDSKGHSIYKFQLSNKKDSRQQNSILTGTLYLDAKTLDVLKFEGRVENMFVDVYKDFYRMTSPILFDVSINYSHEKGYTEVENIAYKVTNGDMTSTAIMYNVGEMDLGVSSKQGKKTGENMLLAIDDAGFDRMLWEHSNIVQRTQEEEMLAGLPDQTMLVNESIEEEPATPTAKLLDHLKKFGRALPQEKVYVHMDNTCYIIGDTIWFSAYTTQTNDSKPSQISGVLYVELYNHEGYLVERKLLEMYNGRGFGNFIIDKEAYPGYYELRAYTRWQLNWGMYERNHATDCADWFYSRELEHNYFRDYDKLYSRVFPVYDMPTQEGDYTTKMTRKVMRRTFKKDPHERQRVLTLYPEGGELVEGLPCRVAFEATWDDGQELEGKLMNAKAENRGRGTFEITPTAQEKRELVFTTTDGNQVKAPLPQVAKTGVALRVDEKNDTVDIVVRRTNDLLTDSMGLSIMHEGVLETFWSIEGGEAHFKVAKRALKVGVNQATVFDEMGHVWADRLFFVKDSTTTRQNVVIGAVKDAYEPYEAITLTVQATGQEGGNMSLAVRDASHRDVLYDNASLQTEMLLTSEIKGFVPNPEFYFEKNDHVHNRALDLLMLTQGWRRFKWDDMAVKDAWQLTQVAERTPIITGKVYKTSNDLYWWMASSDAAGFTDEEKEAWNEWNEATRQDKHYNRGYQDNHWQRNVNELLTSSRTKTSELTDIEYYPGKSDDLFKNKAMRVHTEWVAPGGEKSAAIDLDTKDGYFKVQLPRFYGTSVLFLSAADTLKWKGKPYNWIQLMDDKNLTEPRKFRKYKASPPNYHVRVDFPYPRFVKPYSYYQTHLNYSYDPLLSPMVLNDGSLQIDEVTVWSKHNRLNAMEDSIPALIVDAYDAFNETLDAGLSLSRTGIAHNYVGDYGLEKPFEVDEGGGKDYMIIERFGYDINRRAINDISLDPDSAYLRRNLRSFARYKKMFDWETMRTYLVPNLNMTEEQMAPYDDYTHLDKYVLYTDYEPRLAGHERYRKGNMPETQIAVYPFPDDSRRAFYRDRRYKMEGFSYANEFYHPNYSKRRMDEHPKDYRRTLYWNPFLRLDNNGKATIHFYNNSSRHPISIDAQGFGQDGTPLSGNQ